MKTADPWQAAIDLLALAAVLQCVLDFSSGSNLWLRLSPCALFLLAYAYDWV